MGFAELFLIAVGLSMDAFAVSVCKGLGMRTLDWRQASLIALFFGGFQALMPALGWALGAQFAQMVASASRWIAFALLAFVGGKMLLEGLRGEDQPLGSVSDVLGLKELLMLAVATSIDAFAVGVSFAFLEVAIAPSVALIGATTFMLSLLGVVIGHQFGSRWERPATIVGGAVLVLIGLKVLI